MKNFLILLLLIPITLLAEVTVPGRKDLPQPEDRSLLFNRGDMGSTFWRIPALATTNSGVVIAAADRRNDSNKDLPNNIDVVIRRSYDSGNTWTPLQMVLEHDSLGGFGDTALGVHRPSGALVIVAAHGNGLWEATADDPMHVVVTRSLDDGVTWSEPIDITKQLYDPIEGVAPIKAVSGFASSGTMLCDDNGRLIFLLVTRTRDPKWSELNLYQCYSDDGGLTWNINTTPIDEDADESKITQLIDGSYYVSIRNRHKGPRKTSRSTDGTNFTEVELNDCLIDPACNGDLIALTPSQMKELGLDGKVGPKGILIHSITNDPKDRKNVSILVSDDGGWMWKKIFTVAPHGSSYSAITMLPDGNLGCLTEENASEGGFRLWFTKIDLKGLLGSD